LATGSKLWSVGVIGCLAVLALATLILPHSFQLTAFSDVIQCFLLFSGTLLFVPRALRSSGRMRLFWSLMALGMALWFFYQSLWVYFEVWLRQDVPDVFAGDIVLFLHIVPLMAAVALRPHVPRNEYAAPLGHLDFTLLLFWWIYIYVLVVMSWQYAVVDAFAYTRNLNAVYLVEKLAFLSALAACWLRSKGPWKAFYANLFGASLLYAAASYVANLAIAQRLYYSGSLYDIALASSMAWIAMLGIWSNAEEPRAETSHAPTAYGVWVARSGMIAVFSLPLFAAWALYDTAVPPSVRSFRLVLTLGAALAMGVMVLIRQRLLDRELIRLLNQSRDSFENLTRLQAQVLQSEKLASIGQLVGGAAHELNNPITAMLGYSDLLLGTQLTSAQHALAVKIGQYVRRTKSLVAGLLSIARKGPSKKTLIDLNTLARTAVRVTQPQWEALKVEIQMELDDSLPKILGDSNQLLQVCLQIVGNALYALEENRGRALTLVTEHHNGTAVLQVSEGALRRESVAVSPPLRSLAPGDHLGLSACQPIVQEHEGRILCQTLEHGATLIRVELPVGASPTGKVSRPGAPVLRQPLPYA
jgi:signal transduction histidine kinase